MLDIPDLIHIDRLLKEYPKIHQVMATKEAAPSEWIDHANDHGFTAKGINSTQLNKLKDQHQVPANYRSCHTAVSQDGYVFEGHIPAKYVQQFLQENHLRWDSLGEFLALAVSLDHYGNVNNNSKATILGEALDDATDRLLETSKSPSRKAGELDNRGSQFYLTLYWAEALAAQTQDTELQERFKTIASSLKASESKIVNNLNKIQGASVDIDGYYNPNDSLVANAMRPDEKFNEILNQL